MKRPAHNDDKEIAYILPSPGPESKRVRLNITGTGSAPPGSLFSLLEAAALSRQIDDDDATEGKKDDDQDDTGSTTSSSNNIDSENNDVSTGGTKGQVTTTLSSPAEWKAVCRPLALPPRLPNASELAKVTSSRARRASRPCKTASAAA